MRKRFRFDSYPEPTFSPRADTLVRCAICGWRLGDEDGHRPVADPRGEIKQPICEHCAACRMPRAAQGEPR